MEEKKIRRTQLKKKQKRYRMLFYIALCLGICLFTVGIIYMFSDGESREGRNSTGKKGTIDDSYEWPDFEVDLLSLSSYTRSGKMLEKVNNIVVHYTANPNTSAKQNRDYFEGLSISHETKASCHFIVGLKGEVLQLIPLNEMSYASNNRNSDTISIETCHEDASGEFSKVTYQKLVEMCAWLCLRYNLTEDDIIRHYDITGKMCPKYYVEHEDAWNDLKSDVAKKMKNYPKKEETSKEEKGA